MSIFSDAAKLALKGLKAAGLGIIEELFPGRSDSPEKLKAKMAMQDAIHNFELESQRIDLERDQLDSKREAEWNRRTEALEGTANDLKGIKFFGPLVIFMRGAFRPLFTYLVAYFDIMWFSGKWEKPEPDFLLVINLVVLVFWFGERALKNLMPVFGRFIQTKNGGGGE